MMKLTVLVLGALFMCAQAEKKDWALLIAGSNGWYNYRHQADIMHAYHTVRRLGVAPERIVVMMYDDVANNSENPFPGKVYNEPNGPDVNVGVPRDYTGGDVTPSNFLAVLQGKPMSVGTKRVIASGPEDHVFVYFADHGAPGLLGFPSYDVLYAKDLIPALKSMHAAKQFAQLVFYVEACESGSMFNGLLPKDINVYAMTAANGHESSWGNYCDNDKGLPCLGDLFSNVWMEDSDAADGAVETLKTQYANVKAKTVKSHVQEFGDLSIQAEVLDQFEGGNDPAKQPTAAAFVKTHATGGMVPTRDIPLFELTRQLAAATTAETRAAVQHKLAVQVQGRRKIDNVMDTIVRALVPAEHMQTAVKQLSPTVITQWECHHTVTQAYHVACHNLAVHPYALTHVAKLTNLCEMGLNPAHVAETVANVCTVMSDEATLTERIH